MGEAKRRMAAQKLPDDIKTDIASCVRSVNVVLSGGGTCFFRQTVAAYVFHAVELPFKRQFGGMIYRCGPDPLWDIVAFCGPGNAGSIESHAYLGHAWLESNGCIVDFTVGDWQEQITGCIRLGAQYGGDDEDRPVNWTVPPLPSFFWRNAFELTRPWRHTGEPEIGEAWYGPLAHERGQELWIQDRLRSYVKHAESLLSPAIPPLLDNVRASRLKERVREFFNGEAG